MKRIMLAATAAVVLVAAAVATTGCTRVRLQDSPSTKTFTESGSVRLAGAKGLRADISQGIGDLTVRASSQPTDSVRTAFTFRPESWRPEVSSSVDGTSADLRIAQPNTSKAPLFTDVRNTWVITLPQGLPTDLTMKLGVGTSDVDLRDVELTRLSALTGVGETTIDLSGPRTTDLVAHIQSGVGKLTVRVPKNVGVQVSGAAEGVGHFSADGFISQGDLWMNQAHSGTGPKIQIDLVRGVGDVTLEMVD